MGLDLHYCRLVPGAAILLAHKEPGVWRVLGCVLQLLEFFYSCDDLRLSSNRRTFQSMQYFLQINVHLSLGIATLSCGGMGLCRTCPSAHCELFLNERFEITVL